VGIPKVPRIWRKRAHNEPGSDFVPQDVDLSSVRLIEPPITIKRPASEADPIPVEAAPPPNPEV